jgi:5'-nucleotidase
MEKPLILISNDDGIDSPNLHALVDGIEASELSAEVLVIAPERQRSAASHTITLHKPLRLHAHGTNRYALSGTPVDCVYVGMLELAKRTPKLVLSGINLGFNLGTDVFYSGTVAAAVEGGLRGIRSIAFSLAPSPDRDLVAAVRFCVALIARALEDDLPPRTVLNVNLPARMGSGYAWTRLGRRDYNDDVHERMDPRGRPYYWIGGGMAPLDSEPDTDSAAVAGGLASITPLGLDPTHPTLLDDARSWQVAGYRSATTMFNPEAGDSDES